MLRDFWDKQNEGSPGLNYCCRGCATCLLFLAAVLIVIAVATPWWFLKVDQEIPEHLGQNATVNTITVGMAYWPGIVFVTQDYPDYVTKPSTIHWSDMSSEKPKQAYYAAVSMAILSLIPTVALFLISGMAFFGVANRFLYTVSCNWLNVYLIMLGLLMWVFSNLAWAVFFYWPTALNDASEQCFDKQQDKYYCEDFMGSEDDLNPVVDLKLMWGPFVGWWVMLFVGAMSFVTLGLLCFVGMKNRGYGAYYERIPSYS